MKLVDAPEVSAAPYAARESAPPRITAPLIRDPEAAENVLASARRSLEHEAACLRAMAERLGAHFALAVELIGALEGRLVVTGVGKSGLIGKKIAATLSSTGTASFFMHASDALHGDLGMVTSEDAVLLISSSGETDEVLALLPHLRAREVLTLALVGRTGSTLARGSDLVLDAGVEREACPHDLVPTASTTAALALGDALALAVMDARDFGPGDFAARHPGGQLGAALRRRSGGER